MFGIWCDNWLFAQDSNLRYQDSSHLIPFGLRRWREYAVDWNGYVRQRRIQRWRYSPRAPHPSSRPQRHGNPCEKVRCCAELQKVGMYHAFSGIVLYGKRILCNRRRHNAHMFFIYTHPVIRSTWVITTYYIYVLWTCSFVNRSNQH